MKRYKKIVAGKMSWDRDEVDGLQSEEWILRKRGDMLPSQQIIS